MSRDRVPRPVSPFVVRVLSCWVCPRVDVRGGQKMLLLFVLLVRCVSDGQVRVSNRCFCRKSLRMQAEFVHPQLVRSVKS